MYITLQTGHQRRRKQQC